MRRRLRAPAAGGPRRWRVAAAALTATTLSCAGPRDSQAQTAGAVRDLRAGRYEPAIAALRSRAGDETDVAARRQLLRALAEVGQYAAAESAGRRFTAGAKSPELWNAFGEVLYRRGNATEAQAAFERALAGRAADSLTARYNLGVLRYERGATDDAVAHFRRVADAGDARNLTAEQLTAVGSAYRYLGRDDPQLFRAALAAFDAAIAADSTDPEPRRRLGELFLEKYNAADAGETFDALLKTNPGDAWALLGMARVKQFDGAAGGEALVRRSLATNPNLVEARVLLATGFLDAEDYGRATAEIERALAVDSASLPALGALAAVRHLQGDRRGSDEAIRRALARNPRYADLYVTMAELSARHRLYRDAVEFGGRAVALDPKSWRGHALRGINQLRVGLVDAARASLETAFAGDPYDVWVKNTLDLLDATAGYRTTRSARFVFLADSAESPLLTPYLAELLEEGYDRLAERYGYRPPTPVRLELYRRHADFSVRTVGLAGLGALGVSFGTTLAMDSPSAREVGQFHWGSTAWHELAHTFTLGVTNNRVPRWLSEGLSVVEERRARPGWGEGVTPAFLAAYKAGRLHPVSRLNDGFTRPAYPEQVIFSYTEASLVCEFIEQEWGPRAIRDLLGAYRDGLATPAAVQRALRIDMPTLDRRFDAYVRQRFAAPLAALRSPASGNTPPGSADPGDFAAQLAAGRALAEQGRADEAVAHLERAKALFPDYADGDSPYWRLATIYAARGDAPRAAEELTQLTRRNGGHYEAHLRLASLREQLGDHAGAADALERAIYVAPFDAAVHARLAALYSRLGERRKAVRERAAVVALAPVDLPDALYRLALAHSEAGDAAAARREVLRALEQAPNFAPAQELLLKLRAGTGTAPNARPALAPAARPEAR